MAKNELKPCKCGSDVELCRGYDDYYIYCPKCKLKTFSDRVYDNITDNCDRLIEAWNRRAKDENNMPEMREEEKHSTPKGNLERNIKCVFERDFNDLSIKQLGEIASIIMDCGECPIFDCTSSKNQERCNVIFKDALRKERCGEDGKSE